MTKSVFISMGTAFTRSQGKFLDALMDMLRENKVEPRVINKTDYITGSPLKGISAVIGSCHGAIIVAFERVYFQTGTEKRGSTEPLELKDARYTTPWSQIEAAMAFQQGIPILVLAEKGLRHEGLLEDKYDWYVERLEIEPQNLGSREVRSRMQAWCKEVLERKSEVLVPSITQDITISTILKAMSLKTIVQVIAILVAIFGVGFSAGHFSTTLAPTSVQEHR